MAPTKEERIAEALAGGVWKERHDEKTGRVYYVNSQTRKSTWNIIAALDAAEAGGSGGASEVRGAGGNIKNLREDRQEKLRLKAQQLAELKASCASLEQKKVEMEADIARTRGPVEQEAKEIAALKAEVGDMRFSLKVVATEVTEKRKAKELELKMALEKLDRLKNQLDAEKQHRNNVEIRRRQLNAEAMDLKGDLHREQANNEALKAAVRAAERKQDEARLQLARQEIEIQGEEEAVRMAEADLEAIARLKNEALARIERTRKETSLLEERLAQAKLAENNSNAANRNATNNNSRQNNKQSDLLGHLTQKYEAKQRTLKALSVKETKESDAQTLEHSNAKLRQLIKTSQRDAAALHELSDCLDLHLQRTQGLTEEYKRERLALTQTTGLNNTDGSLIRRGLRPRSAGASLTTTSNNIRHVNVTL